MELILTNDQVHSVVYEYGIKKDYFFTKINSNDSTNIINAYSKIIDSIYDILILRSNKEKLRDSAIKNQTEKLSKLDKISDHNSKEYSEVCEEISRLDEYVSDFNEEIKRLKKQEDRYLNEKRLFEFDEKTCESIKKILKKQ